MIRIEQGLEQVAQARPEALAVVEGDRRISFGALQARIERSSRALSAQGIGAGQAVGVFGDGGIDYIILSYAVLRAGAAVVPMRPQGGEAEQARIVQELSLRAILAPAGVALPSLSGAPFQMEGAEISGLHLSGGPVLAELAALDPAFIRFTSGTTAAARGVVLSHATIRARHQAANEGLHIDGEDGVLFLLSMSHHFVVSVMLYLSVGCRILLPRRNLIPEMAGLLAEHRPSFIYGAPRHFSLLAEAGRGALDSVRMAISTTAGLPEGLATRFRARHGRGISQAYGIIEVGLPAVDLEGRGSGVGPPLPSFELSLLHAQEGVGRVAVRGPGMLDAYLSPYRPQAAVLEDGWFLTGDLGRLDPEGRLELLGREASVINFGGVKIFPATIEAQLNAHPEVERALLHGEPHPRFGQVPCARVVPVPGARPTEGALIDWLRARLPADQIPVEISIVEALPQTSTGKLLRH